MKSSAKLPKCLLRACFAVIAIGMVCLAALLSNPHLFAKSLVWKNGFGATVRSITSCCSPESQRQIHALEEFIAIDDQYKAEFFVSGESNQASVLVNTVKGDRSTFVPITRTTFILRVDRFR